MQTRPLYVQCENKKSMEPHYIVAAQLWTIHYNYRAACSKAAIMDGMFCMVPKVMRVHYNESRINFIMRATFEYAGKTSLILRV